MSLQSRSTDVAVVIPVFNRATIIGKTLDSLAAQSRAPTQVIVVDDGSADDTVATAERWFQCEPRPFLRMVIRAEHGLCAAARNRGVREAAPSEFLHFLDSDDVLPPDFYERAVAKFQERPETELVSADQFYTDRNENQLRERSLAGLATDSRRWVRTGRIFRDVGQLREARRCYRKAIRHRPLFLTAYRRLLELAFRR